MGLRVIAMDVGEEKLKFCLELGADFVVSAMAPDAAAQVVTITSGGSHGVCVFASQASAFKAAIDMCRRKVDPSNIFFCVIKNCNHQYRGKVIYTSITMNINS